MQHSALVKTLVAFFQQYTLNDPRLTDTGRERVVKIYRSHLRKALKQPNVAAALHYLQPAFSFFCTTFEATVYIEKKHSWYSTTVVVNVYQMSEDVEIKLSLSQHAWKESEDAKDYTDAGVELEALLLKDRYFQPSAEKVVTFLDYAKKGDAIFKLNVDTRNHAASTLPAFMKAMDFLCTAKALEAQHRGFAKVIRDMVKTAGN